MELIQVALDWHLIPKSVILGIAELVQAGRTTASDKLSIQSVGRYLILRDVYSCF